jgi:hypothetical protein
MRQAGEHNRAADLAAIAGVLLAYGLALVLARWLG